MDNQRTVSDLTASLRDEMQILQRNLNNQQVNWGTTPVWSGSATMSLPNPLLGLARDVLRRIHNENGPALYLDNGTVLYFWHGVIVPEWVVMNPEKITPRIILNEQNIELRRILIERFGQGKFLKELGAEKEHEDKWGILWKVTREKLLKPVSSNSPSSPPLNYNSQIDQQNRRHNDEINRLFSTVRILKYVQVKDPSTTREYFLPVPSTIKRAKQAVAWTFHLKEEEYEPQKES